MSDGKEIRMGDVIETSEELKEILRHEREERSRLALAFHVVTADMARQAQRSWQAVFEQHPELKRFDLRLTADLNVRVVDRLRPDEFHYDLQTEKGAKL